MTPPRLFEVRCPCGAVHWEIDSDCRGIDGTSEPYGERRYHCPACQRLGPGYQLLRQSPHRFLIGLGRRPLADDEAEWVEVLRRHFPDHPSLQRLAAGSRRWWQFWRQA